MNKRKRQIIRSARQLFIDQGFNNTSIVDIIAAANISKGTFYNHFSSKNECLIAIMEEAREEATNRRYEVAMNKELSDMNVLIEQISLLMYVNREHNLVQIFESISGNKDLDIKAVLEKHIILELNWLSNRFVDIFGEKISRISFELAVYAIGMMQSMLRTFIIATGQFASPETVLRTVLKNIETIVPHLLENQGDSVFTPDILQTLLNTIQDGPVSKQVIIEQLEGFINNLTEVDSKKGYEYAIYLLQELLADKECTSIFEAVLSAFNRTYTNTSHEAEAHQIAIYIWRYLHYMKEKK